MIDYFKNLKGATIATLETETKPKTDGPDITKISRIQVMLGSNYSNAVNNQMERENKDRTFVAKPRKWGQRIGCVVEHKGKFYLETQYLKSLNTEYTLDGKSIPKEEAEAHLVTSKPNQGTDKPIVWRDYSFDNIKSIKVNGHEFTR